MSPHQLSHKHKRGSQPTLPVELADLNVPDGSPSMSPGDESATTSSRSIFDPCATTTTATTLSQVSITQSFTPGVVQQSSHSSTNSSRRDPYRKPKLIKTYGKNASIDGIDPKETFVYPHSVGEIPEEVLSELKEIVDTCKRNLSTDSACRSVGQVSFDFRMTGTSPENARASIVVIAAAKSINVIRRTLTGDRVCDYHSLVRRAQTSTSTGLLGVIMHWFLGEVDATDLPIVFIATNPTDPRCGQYSGHPTIISEPGTQHERTVAACGLRVQMLATDHCARTACVLDIDGQSYALTAAHTFYAHCFQGRLTTSVSAMAKAKTITKELGNDPDAAQEQPLGYTSSCQLITENKEIILDSAYVWLPSRPGNVARVSEADWGLIPLYQANVMFNNKFILPGCRRELISVTNIAERHPTSCRPVYIISSSSSIRRGTLLQEISLLTTPGDSDTTLWCVEPDEDYGELHAWKEIPWLMLPEIPKGDSGSLVVDVETKEAYGYVVSVNPFGIVQLLPLSNVVEGIKQTMSSSNVTLAHVASTRRVEAPATQNPHQPLLTTTLESRPGHVDDRDLVYLDSVVATSVSTGGAHNDEFGSLTSPTDEDDASMCELEVFERGNKELLAEQSMATDGLLTLQQPLPPNPWGQNSADTRITTWITTSASQGYHDHHRSSGPRTPRLDDFRIAIICALDMEAEAVAYILDEMYNSATLPSQVDKFKNYTLGRIGRHNVVLVRLPSIGNVSAAMVANDLKLTFPRIMSGLAFVVGICGVVPQRPDGEEIYLGDCIISTAIQRVDYPNWLPPGRVGKQARGLTLSTHPHLQSWLETLQSKATLEQLTNSTAAYSTWLSRSTGLEPPDTQSDQLFPTSLVHMHHSAQLLTCHACQSASISDCWTAAALSCSQLGCESVDTRYRPSSRPLSSPMLHFGMFGSANSVIKSGQVRDALARESNIIAFEMEGSGIWDILPTIVVKGACDYADSHNNRNWQLYAAAVAAAGVKAMLEKWTISAVLSEPESIKRDTMKSVWNDCRISLAFDQMEVGFQSIKSGQTSTCRWLLATPEYQSWLLSENQELLWIKGKPGSGKSTLMKYLVEHVEGSSRKVASFFFSRRNNSLGRSATGLYRSLLYQLLHNQRSGLSQHFVSVFGDAIRDEIGCRQWSALDLQHFLLICCQRGWLQDTVLIIDALDECNEDVMQQVVWFAEELLASAPEAAQRPRICLSSRYSPHIQIMRSTEFHLDQSIEHGMNIAKYAETQLLHATSSTNLAAETIADLVSQLVEKARGMFLWVTLVLHNLEVSSIKHDTPDEISKLLQNTPVEMLQFCDSILDRREIDRCKALMLLSFVGHCSQPLSPRELYFLYLGAKETPDSLVVAMTTSDNTCQCFVETASGGLLEVQWRSNTLSGKSHPPTVRFVHESIADFLGTLNAIPKRPYPTLRCTPREPNILLDNFDELFARMSLEVIKSGYGMDYVLSKSHVEHVFLTHVAKMKDASKMSRLLLDFLATMSRLCKPIRLTKRHTETRMNLRMLNPTKDDRDDRTTSHASDDSGIGDCEFRTTSLQSMEFSI